jgi:hypothetical protein
MEAAAELTAFQMHPMSGPLSPVASIAALLLLKIVSKDAQVVMAGKLATGPEYEVKPILVLENDSENRWLKAEVDFIERIIVWKDDCLGG